MTTPTNTTIIIGHAWVDSGQMMLGDPCYLDKWLGHDFASDRPGEYSYAGACTATLSDQSSGMLGEGLAAVFTTGYGDGAYPVRATYNSEGRIISVEVIFDSDEDSDDRPSEDSDEQCGHCGVMWLADEVRDGLCPDCYELGDDNEGDDG